MPRTGFIWFDSAKNSWWDSTLNLGKHIKIVPTFPYTRTSEADPYFLKTPDSNRGYQSAQTLHEHYGGDLDTRLMGVDAFYALHGLFRFCAFSEIQFLNLMGKQLSLWRSDRDNTRKKGTAFDYDTLEQTRLLIEDHLTYLEETVELIQCQKSPDWPVATEKSDIRTTEVAAHQLVTDYTYLQNRATRLLRLYEDKTLAPERSTMMKPHSLISLSKKYSAIFQTFLLVPIFVATFFSMNFRELQDLSVWVYFSTLLGLLLVNLPVLWFVYPDIISTFREGMIKWAKRQHRTSM